MTHYVDPDMAPILARIRAAPVIDFPNLPMDEGRRISDANSAYWAAPVEGVETEATAYRAASEERPARVYTPRNAAPDALIIHVHGGGWTFGSLDSHERAARLFARESGVAVASIDYRLAPEHPSPAGLDDVIASVAAARAGAFGPAPSRIALTGDSAGANLALGAMLKMRDEGLAPVSCAALCYGCFGPVFDTSSHRAFGGGGFQLTTERMRWYWANHLGGAAPNAYSAPLNATDFSGLPPLFLNAAALDPLHDDVVLIAPRIAASGVPVTIEIVPGVVHGFLQMTKELPAALRAIRTAARFMADRLRS